MTKMPSSSSGLSYNNVRIRYNTDGLLSLTDMWHAVGAPRRKSPAEWQRRSEGVQCVTSVANGLQAERSSLLRISRGRFGGTWAHWQIALDYARYLSPAFYAWCAGEDGDRPPPIACYG